MESVPLVISSAIDHNGKHNYGRMPVQNFPGSKT